MHRRRWLSAEWRKTSTPISSQPTSTHTPVHSSHAIIGLHSPHRLMRVFQHSVTQCNVPLPQCRRNVPQRRNGLRTFYATHHAVPQCCSHWLNNVNTALWLVKFASGVAEKNRSRFCFLAERRCSVCMRLRKKVRTFCCVKTLALRYVTLRYGTLENA